LTVGVLTVGVGSLFAGVFAVGVRTSAFGVWVLSRICAGVDWTAPMPTLDAGLATLPGSNKPPVGGGPLGCA
jgi:hypothetical protein